MIVHDCTCTVGEGARVQGVYMWWTVNYQFKGREGGWI